MAVTDVYPIEQKGDKGILNSFSLQMMFFLSDSFLDMLDVVVQNFAFIIIQMQDRIDIQFQTAVQLLENFLHGGSHFQDGLPDQ